MFDRIFAPLLTFVMLIGGTGAVVSALFFEPRPEAVLTQGMPPEVIEFERVMVTGKRSAMNAVGAKVATTDATPRASHAAEGRSLVLRRSAE